MYNLIANQYGKVDIDWDADSDPMFIYSFVDNDGKSDDCEYAFVFKGNKVHLYGWHFGHDTSFTYEGNWMDNNAAPEGFHDHDYQDALVAQLRLCIRKAFDRIMVLTTEYL